MAQPTSCDGSRGPSRLSHNNLRRRKWRKRLPRAPRRRPRRSGSSSDGTWGVPESGTPFFYQVAALPCRELTANANRRHQRPTCQAAECAEVERRNRTIQDREGGDSNGQESSEGRKEEGSEEAVRPPLSALKGALSGPLFHWCMSDIRIDHSSNHVDNGSLGQI